MVFGLSQEKSDKPAPEKWLKRSRFIKDIISPDKNFLLYNGESVENQVKKAVKNITLSTAFEKNLQNHIISYLNAPIIKIKFPDPYDKAVFERDLYNDAGSLGEALYKSNRLEFKNIKNVLYTAEDFAMTVFLSKPETEDSLKEKVAEIRDMIKEEYEKKPFEAKVLISEKVAELAKELCIALIESQNKNK